MAFGKIVKALGKTFNTINRNLHTVFTGKRALKPGQKASIASKVTDIGIFGLLDLISTIDLCNILQYALNQLNNSIPKEDQFDPTKKPNDTDAYIIRAKWNVQKLAYDIQLTIDNYNAKTATIIDKTKLNNLIQDLSSQLEKLLNPTIPGSTTDPDLLNAFPALGLINNYLKNSLGFINANSDVRNIPDANIQKIIKYIDNTRGVCVKIQALQSPLSVAASFLSPLLQDQLKQVEKVIDPKKIISALKSIQQAAQAINKVVRLILSIVRTAQVFIKIIILLITVFKVIAKFLKILPAPNIYTTVGITTLISSTEKNITDKIKEVLIVLESLSALLESIISKCQILSNDIATVISKIDIILANLESCKCAPKELLNELRVTRNELNESKKQLDAFIVNYTNKKANKNKSIGKYSIVIETEKTAVNNFRLVRRYGIALDINGILVVESTPTYASDDNIIIQEVKLLLASKGLLPSLPNTLTVSELSTLENALAFLEDDSLSTDFLDSISQNLDSQDNEDMVEFVNNLSGGKKLRKKMRERMAAANKQLQDNLNKSRR